VIVGAVSVTATIFGNDLIHAYTRGRPLRVNV
jgi:hypothetical protein